MFKVKTNVTLVSNLAVITQIMVL